MQVVILTSFLRGLAPLCIPPLAQEPDITIKMVIYCQGRSAKPGKLLRQKLKKTLRIGLLGMLNGQRMTRWYRREVFRYIPDTCLEEVTARCGVRLETTPTVNCQRTRDLFIEADADLGISLGNDYIAPSVFSIPPHGMINIHHEILPDFQGASSVIWQIYEGSTNTGYTIHQVARQIDAGDVLYQENMPIAFRPTLRETVSYNYARLMEASAKGLVMVAKHYTELASQARPQKEGRTFTTPTFGEYLHMVRQHRRLYRDYVPGESG
jgi:methionyl-tRNA formyltransferase